MSRDRCELCDCDLSVRQEWRRVVPLSANATPYYKRVRVKPLQAVISFRLEGQWPRSEMERALGLKPQSFRAPIRFCQPCFSTANASFLEALSVAIVKRLEKGER